eukprot:53690-Amphidinium_carterae.1
MPEANGEPASQEENLGEETEDVALAVEEARKRIHTQLDAGEDPLTSTPDREGHEVLERLHLRPAAKASRMSPEEKNLGTGLLLGGTRPAETFGDTSTRSSWRATAKTISGSRPVCLWRTLDPERTSHTKEQGQRRRSQLCRTTKVTNFSSGFGKASMLQRAPPRTLCVRHTQGWSTAHVENTRTFASTGRGVLAVHGFGLDDRPPDARTVRNLELGYRFYHWKPHGLAPQLACERNVGWLPPTCRIGEATKPGPTICSVNPGGWSL